MTEADKVPTGLSPALEAELTLGGLTKCAEQIVVSWRDREGTTGWSAWVQIARSMSGRMWRARWWTSNAEWEESESPEEAARLGLQSFLDCREQYR